MNDVFNETKWVADFTDSFRTELQELMDELHSKMVAQQLEAACPGAMDEVPEGLD